MNEDVTPKPDLCSEIPCAEYRDRLECRVQSLETEVRKRGHLGDEVKRLDGLVERYVKERDAALLQVSDLQKILVDAEGMFRHGSSLQGTHASILWKTIEAYKAKYAEKPKGAEGVCPLCYHAYTDEAHRKCAAIAASLEAPLPHVPPNVYKGDELSTVVGAIKRSPETKAMLENLINEKPPSLGDFDLSKERAEEKRP